MASQPSHLSSSTRRTAPWTNLAVGASMAVFQVTTLGQPMEVLKTYVAANRKDSLSDAVRATWARGGVRSFYQGLVPWAWVEALTKGSILFLASTEAEHASKTYLGASPAIAGTLGGVAGGAAQAYITMGFTTCMKTIEVTRPKSAGPGVKVPGTMEIFVGILRTQGISGVYRGVNAVALRQITGWSSRIGISRFAEGQIRRVTGKAAETKLGMLEKVAASTAGGALSCWNQPFEVLRVEMQAIKSGSAEGKSASMSQAARNIMQTSGPLGFFRGIVPRIGVAAWATICLVGLGDGMKEFVSSIGHRKPAPRPCVEGSPTL